MKVLKDLPNLPEAQKQVQQGIEDWQNADLTPEEQESVDTAVLRAQHRVTNRVRRQYSQEKDQLKYFTDHDNDPIHATHLSRILDPKRYYLTSRLSKSSAPTKLTEKQKQRIRNL